MKFLTDVFRGRSGQLENTVFTILAPDGKTRLARPSRSPGMTFGWDDTGVQRMVTSMARIAKRYRPKASVRALPRLKNVRLGLNVAACDSVALVVIRAPSAAVRKRWEGMLQALAYEDALRGLFVYAPCGTLKELAHAKIQGASTKNSAALLIVQPDSYGQNGKVLAQSKDGIDKKTLRVLLKKGLAAHLAVSKGDHRTHVRNGRRNKVYWETETPVTDSHRPRPGR